MKSAQSEIHTALVALHNGIRQADGPAAAAATARLDELLEQSRTSLPPQLGHFLERRSYAKALVWLDGAVALPPAKG